MLKRAVQRPIYTKFDMAVVVAVIISVGLLLDKVVQTGWAAFVLSAGGAMVVSSIITLSHRHYGLPRRVCGLSWKDLVPPSPATATRQASPR